MRVRVIFNPTANHGKSRPLLDKIETLGKAFGAVDVVTTEAPGHAVELARSAIEDGIDIVAAAGGDGTIHEIVNGLVIDGKAEATLGFIPMGSGNDFAFGLDQDIDLGAAMRNLFTAKPCWVDLIKIENEYGQTELVNNGLGIGFDATVTIQSRLITRVHGFAMYFLAALRTIALYYKTPHMKMFFDDKPVEQDALLVAVGNGPRIGGGFLLTPDASFDDGLIDSCTINPVSRPTMLYMLPQVMRGSHISSRHVTMRRNKSIEISSDLALPIHLDGEIYAYPEDDVHEVKLTILPKALPVLYPQHQVS